MIHVPARREDPQSAIRDPQTAIIGAAFRRPRSAVSDLSSVLSHLGAS
jgi:hypothetical protein